MNETNRLYGVLNKQLAEREFIAGDYSIADMASYPWVVPWKSQSQNIDDFPHLKRWLETIRDRPATRARLCQGQGGQPEFRPAPDPHRRRAQDIVRADRVGGAVDHDLCPSWPGLDPAIHVFLMRPSRGCPGQARACE